MDSIYRHNMQHVNMTGEVDYCSLVFVEIYSHPACFLYDILFVPSSRAQIHYINFQPTYS